MNILLLVTVCVFVLKLGIFEFTFISKLRAALTNGNALYLSMENLLSHTLVSKNTRIKIYRTIILPVVLYGCENLSLTLREEHRLRAIKNGVVRKDYANEIIGNRTRYLPACSSVPQPNAPRIFTRYKKHKFIYELPTCCDNRDKAKG